MRAAELDIHPDDVCAACHGDLQEHTREDRRKCQQTLDVQIGMRHEPMPRLGY